MLSIFKKKFYLKDQLEGFIDIHNHILPGIDDGAAEVEDSLNLIHKFKEMGVSNFVATPHIMNDYYPNTPFTINAALDKLRIALEGSGISDVQVKAAAEYMMDHSFMELLEQEPLLCLHQNYVLVEMSYFQAPINLNEILFTLQTKQYKPVLAHPERYAYLHSKNLERYEDLKRRGCLFQLNILSLIGHYGSNIQKAAFALLDKGMIDLIGTDTHQERHLEKLANARLPKKRIEQVIPVIERTKELFTPAFS
ncbi:tyrosine-protein phosphatase [Salinimicrobium flavum]|uniref:protein-tyrosine-phosphatase n=1 Tax=Salinimicrobium flavum TaxID=1737065 RepID=A0ABW5IZC7_9FLAO